MTLSFAGMGTSMLLMAAGLALPSLGGAPRPAAAACRWWAACQGLRPPRRLRAVLPPFTGRSCHRPCTRSLALSCAGLTGAIALLGTLAYILSFAMGAGPVPGLLVPEITPARIRGAPRRRFAACMPAPSMHACARARRRAAPRPHSPCASCLRPPMNDNKQAARCRWRW